MIRRNIPKRSIRLSTGRNLIVTLEDDFWIALRHIAAERDVLLRDLITEIGADQFINQHSISSAIRVWILNYRQSQVIVLASANLMLEAKAASSGGTHIAPAEPAL